VKTDQTATKTYTQSGRKGTKNRWRKRNIKKKKQGQEGETAPGLRTAPAGKSGRAAVKEVCEQSQPRNESVKKELGGGQNSSKELVLLFVEINSRREPSKMKEPKKKKSTVCCEKHKSSLNRTPSKKKKTGTGNRDTSED